MNFSANPFTGDVSILVDANAVITSVKNLVLTNHYERPFHPEIGSSVTQLLFNDASSLTANYIQQAIEEVIENFEPRVTLQSVVVQLLPDQNSFQATITFFVLNIQAPITINMLLKLTR